jgi:hypothetical protein
MRNGFGLRADGDVMVFQTATETFFSLLSSTEGKSSLEA